MNRTYTKTWTRGPRTSPVDLVPGPPRGPCPTTDVDHPLFYEEKFYQRCKGVIGNLSAALWAAHNLPVQSLLNSIHGFGLVWWRSNILWRRLEERCERSSLLRRLFFVSSLLCTLPKLDPSLDSPWKCLFIGKLIESCLWIKHKMMHINVMSTKLVRCLTNHHIV